MEKGDAALILIMLIILIILSLLIANIEHLFPAPTVSQAVQTAVNTT